MLKRVTFDRTVLAIGGLLVFAIAARPAIDNDLWWHLRSGQWMVDHHAVLRADPFSHTRRGAIREPTDWLSQLGLYGTWAVGGLTWVALLVAAIATAGMALIVRACRGPMLVRALVGALAAAAASVFWSARPQMATFLLTAVVVWAMVRVRRQDGGSTRWLWWLVPLFALWSNLHLGWFYGLVVLGATWFGETVEARRGRPALDSPGRRTLLAVTAASVLAVMVNPVGPRVWAVVVTQVSVGRAYIQENQPPTPSSGMAIPFFVMLAVTLVVLVLRRRQLSVTDVVLVGFTAAAALTSVRTVPLFATVAAPILAFHLGALVPAREGAEAPTAAGAINVAIVAVVAVLALALTSSKLSTANVATETAKEYPVGAVAWVRQHRPPRNLLNTFDWGGYLIWHLRTYPVSIDGRADLYTEALESYGDLLDGKGWRPVVAREHIGVAILPNDAGLTQAMAADPAWRVAYRDQVATVLVRR